MPAISTSYNLDAVEWRRVTDPDCKSFRVDFEYSLLGYDLPSGRLDMLLRYGKGGHCRPHRHVAATVTLVLEGEQFLKESLPDTRACCPFQDAESLLATHGSSIVAGSQAERGDADQIDEQDVLDIPLSGEEAGECARCDYG